MENFMKKGCKIESIGVRYPEKQVSTAEILGRLNVPNVPKLELLTGIKNRRVCSKGEDSLTLAVDAIMDCLTYSEYRAEDIEMVIYCSISKYIGGLIHYYEPPMSALIMHKIGNNRALHFDISNACAGMLTGSMIAMDFISRGAVENCLVVSGEYITSISDNAEKNITSTQHPEIASLTVGDAGAAVILTRTEIPEEMMSVDMVTLSEYSHLCLGNQASCQPGGSMKTYMQEIHTASIKNAPRIVEQSLIKAGLEIKDIDYLIPHQTAKQSILAGAKAFTRYFGEVRGEILINLEDTGNTASTTNFTTLYKNLQNNHFREGDRIMLLSFASGLVIGTMIFTFYDIIHKYGNHH
jgi:3-oxoacyl-[acyl-carrier-protein] synthase-3